MVYIDNSGYKSAQVYYGALKKQFLNQVQSSTVKEGIDMIQTWSKQIESSFSNGIEQLGKNAGKTSFEILNEIFSKFSTSTTVQALHSELLGDVEKKINEIDIKNKQKRHEYLNQIRASLSNDTKESLRETLIAAINTTSGMTSTTLSELVNSVEQLFIISLSARLQQRKTYALTGLVAVTRQGYIREQMELNALKKFFKNSNVKVTHGGSKRVKINNKNVETVFDNILSVVEYCDQTFSNQVQQGMANITLAEEINNVVIPQFNYYGEQIKSFNIKANKRGQMLHITYNKDLQDKLLEKTQGSYIGLRTNLSFMAEARNIIQAFGPATVLFSSGAGRQWTEDFIDDFRKQNYYLGFTYTDPKKGKISSNISLMSPWVENKKNHRQIKRTTKPYKYIKN